MPKVLTTYKKCLKTDGSEDPTIFNEWANRVAHTAKQICSDPDCKRIKIIETDQGRLNFEIADKDAIDCGIQSIQTFNSNAKDTTRDL
jgi:hypothetical protein